MKKISKKQAIINNKLFKLKCKKLEECNYKCHCGSTYLLQLSHIIPKGREKKYELHPLNSLIDCQKHHIIWEDGSWSDKIKLDNFELRILNMMKLDFQYYQRQFINMPHHVQLICKEIEKHYKKLELREYDNLF